MLVQLRAQSPILKKEAFSIGESIEFHSKILGENRMINVYLPQSYRQDSGKTYAVIYLLDGSADEDFIHISGLVQFASFPWINTLPPSIVVGIANIDRKRDFTFPTTIPKEKADFPGTGGSEQFIQFIEKELQPLIKENYRVNGTQSIIGQSLGGLLATEILFKKPEIFDNYIIISPSLWWDNSSLLDLEPIAYQSRKAIYIGLGDEGKIMKDPAERLLKKLQLRQNTNTVLYYEFFEELDHGDALHLAVYDSFEKIFGKKDSIR